MVCWITKVNGMWARYVNFTRDLVCQGHVTLQVTYLISGPIHARDMIFFLFPWFLGSRKSKAWKPDTWLWRVTLYVKVTGPYKWPILSRALYMLETWFFFVSMVSWVKEVNGMKTRYVALTRDLVCQGHVTLQVTYLISGPIHTRDMIFLFPWFVGSR